MMINSATGKGNNNKSSNSGSNNGRILRITVLFLAAVEFSRFYFYDSAYPFQYLPTSLNYTSASSPPPPIFPSAHKTDSSQGSDEEVTLERTLKRAAMGDKTVILTTLNEAWAAPNSIIDLFLESFRIGIHTRWLLNHLIIIAMDQKAYDRCLNLHPHCYALTTTGANFSREAYFMTPRFKQMMWRRTDFLHSVLELGYNFIFTDADIMWFRDPIPRFYGDTDFQIASDDYKGNSSDVNNLPNGGFKYVKSNNRTIEFYKFWYSSRLTYPGRNEQSVLNKIKYSRVIKEIGLQMRFLDPIYFGGFCVPSEDFNLVCTMHANCCHGVDNKIHDLTILLEDWRKYMSSSSLSKEQASPLSFNWSVPQKCSLKKDRRRFDD